MPLRYQFPQLFKYTINGKIQTYSVEIWESNSFTFVVRRSYGEFAGRKHIMEDEPLSLAKATDVACKYYQDKVNDGYRLADRHAQSPISFPIGKFVFNPLLISVHDFDLTSQRSLDALKQQVIDNIPNISLDVNDVAKSMKAKKFRAGLMDYLADAQGKLNGVRSIARYEISSAKSLFDEPNKVILTSREGIIYDVPHITGYLKKLYEDGIIDKSIALDGEIYCVGLHVATIAGAAKTSSSEHNKHLYFVAFDIACESLIQEERFEMLYNVIAQKLEYTQDDIIYTPEKNKYDFEDHRDGKFNNKPFYILEKTKVSNDDEFIEFTEAMIYCHYEGGILRNRKAPYYFGGRRNNMLKLKKATVDSFIIVDIVPYKKDPTLGLAVLRNDITGDTFECNMNCPMRKKREILNNRADYIGRKVQVRYFERTINEIPFHANVTGIYNGDELIDL